jgi:hypothetical protein
LLPVKTEAVKGYVSVKLYTADGFLIDATPEETNIGGTIFRQSYTHTVSNKSIRNRVPSVFSVEPLEHIL